MSTKKDENKKKMLFYKQWWFWVIIICSILCVSNIILSIIFHGSYGANIFTAISGWVSGIATFFVGLIAYKQNNNYSFLSHKSEVINRICIEQARFSEAINNVLNVNTYMDIVIKNMYNSPSTDGYLNLITGLQSNQLIFKVESFESDLFSFNYFPTQFESFIDICQELKKVIINDLMHFELPSPSTDSKTYREKIIKVSKQILETMFKLRSIKQASFIEMQFLLEQIDKTKSMKELNMWENKINEKMQEVRKKLLFNNLNFKEQNNG